MTLKKSILFSFLILFFLSCKQEKKTVQNIDDIKAKLQQANKQIVKNNSDAIDAYIIRHNWAVEETGTGLRYYIYKNGGGAKIVSGNSVYIEYSLQMLDGTVLIKSDNPTKKAFAVEKENAESGLHEVLTFLHYGDKVKVILPPHLAFGLTGDEKIPPMATLVYDLSVSKNSN